MPAAPLPTASQCALFVAVPLFELVLLVTIRWKKGLPCWRGSPDHFALRLQAAGLTAGQTVLTACAWAAVLGVAALYLPRLSETGQAAVIIGAIASAVLFGGLLWRWEVPQGGPGE